MSKSIVYSLLVLAYFGFSTLPFMEVSAQKIEIVSGNNQSTTVGQPLPNPLRVRVTGITSQIRLIVLFALGDIEMSFSETSDFSDEQAFKDLTSDGEHNIYVKVKPLADQSFFRDHFAVYVYFGNYQSLVKFTGKITDIVSFSSTSTTRSVDEDAAVGAAIGAPVSATFTKAHAWRYSLDGTDRNSFDIDANTGQLKVKTPLFYYIKSTYSVTVKFETYKKDFYGQDDITSSRTIEVTINVNDPGLPIIENERLTVLRIDDQTVALSWDIPTTLNADAITRYQYSIDGGQTWISTGSTDTSITITRDGVGNLPRDKFKIRVTNLIADGKRSVVISSPRPSRGLYQECPVGWQRTDGFAQPNPRVLIHEVNLEMDLQNRISIYKPNYVAIYVHPDEALENLDGWKLQVAVPYNHHRDYLLTAENAVVVDANIEGVEGGFAFIESPEKTPFPMVGMGFTGATVPGFDYRLYDDTGRKVDFGIACYKQGGIFQALKDMEDPRVLRNVLLETLDWDAATYIRSEWTVPTPAPAAPSLVEKTLVGTWANLKKR